MAANDFTLKKEYLHQWFDYKNGDLYYKKSKSRIKIGQKAGYKNSHGYCKITINGQSYPAHRIIFYYHFGFMPKVVDHINQNRSDNRIENLRATDQSWNTIYSKKNTKNTSGYKNVSWHKQCKKWWVRIFVEGKRKSFGLFDNLQDAVKVAKETRIKHHGEFVHHG